ncbi:MAG TPA: hypothetical protein VFJ85_11120 [Acidimicrobiales bacterium]|nr:hypothetical protein [Acidimicrobiales bacterium]
MTPLVALASCPLWPAGRGDHAGLVDALAERGVRAEWVPWDDAGASWGAYDLVVLRETWDYPARLRRFLAWVDAVGAVTTVANPPAAVRWNHHKGYLADLAAAGVPVVPTTVVPAGASPEVPGRGRVVVKPAVGIGGDGVFLGRAGDTDTAAHLEGLLEAGDALVQPFLPSVATAGETSVVMIAGRVTHTVRKRPAGDEFRVHEHRGGVYAEVDPAPAQREVARAAGEAASAITGAELLYARADLVPGDDGQPLLMELELIEPSLYLHVVPAATGRVADAVAERVDQGRHT